MKIDDHTFSTDSQVFPEKMADYFAKEISKPTHSTKKIHSQRRLQSCVLHKVTEDEDSGSIDCNSSFISRIRSNLN